MTKITCPILWEREFDKNKKYIWISEKGENTCEECKRLNGKIFTGDEVPPRPHPNCKCEVKELPDNEENIEKSTTGYNINISRTEYLDEKESENTENEPIEKTSTGYSINISKTEYADAIENLDEESKISLTAAVLTYELVSDQNIISTNHTSNILSQTNKSQIINKKRINSTINSYLNSKMEDDSYKKYDNNFPIQIESTNNLFNLNNEHFLDLKQQIQKAIKQLTKENTKKLVKKALFKSAKTAIPFLMPLYDKYPRLYEPSFSVLHFMSKNNFLKSAIKEGILEIGRDHAVKYDMPEAYNFLKISTGDIDEEYIKKNAKVYSSIREVKDKKQRYRIWERMKSEMPEINDCKVYEFKDTSSVATKIANSNNLRKFLNNNKNTIRIFNTTNDEKIRNIVFENDDSDLYSVLHGAKIRNIKIDPSRQFVTLQIEDFYNFNKGRLSGKGQVGEFLQVEGESKPYYVMINVKVPISILKEK